MDQIFFPLSKILWSLVRPEGWILLLLLLILAALILGRVRAARGLTVFAALLYLGIALYPVGDILLRPLEAYDPGNPALTAPGAIVVLGGGEKALRSAASGLPATNDAGERFLAAIDLARRFPAARVVFTGGTGWFRADTPPGSDVARMIFRQGGVANSRMILEGLSRNTWQNAVHTLPLMDGVDGPVVLVTSAFHMRRALGTFCAAGWRDLIPYPVDFRAPRRGGRLGWQFGGNLRDLDLSVKEWIGLLAYARSGRWVDPAATPGCMAPGMRAGTTN
ncbi:MAG: YdcF family protein [Marinibacterium sp.]